MMLFNKYPKINDCKKCEGTGILQWFDIDGGTIYNWMKPNTKTCDLCGGEKK